MSRYSSHDPYLDPASGVLKNRFAITDEPTLEATEASLVALRSYELVQTPLLPQVIRIDFAVGNQGSHTSFGIGQSF